MALPRVGSLLSRSLLSRNSPRVARSVFRSARATVAIAGSRRQFASSTWRSQENSQPEAESSQTAQQKPIVTDEERARSARTVVLMGVPRHAVRSQIEEIMKDAGLEDASLTMKMNRFTFNGNTHAYIELPNPEEAQKAVEKLKDATIPGEPSPMRVSIVYPDFSWTRFDSNESHSDRWVMTDADGIAEAIAPLLEGRRVNFNVKAPGWASLDQKIRLRSAENRDVVIRNLSKYGLESVGKTMVNWGDLTSIPRFLCFVDFSTKAGAEKAIRELDNTEIEGLPVSLVLTVVPLIKAHRIGQMDRATLNDLQKAGLAPPVVNDDMLSRPMARPAWTSAPRPRGGRQ
ncbi:hypothetical protein P280DRAFT_262648 [Massarina eburnea CBS 473.64]|uniref:RRM domain-containing protein n=1 Tax=Massarina eburnea CBS 473.64 TaxID=1395130 RepID=A0A6A6S334_9PLEO|nr:hypothetical protein P280DRAFT_262648 [Massarina eburnea CBS 473.64]